MTFTTIDPSLNPSNQTNILTNGGFEVWQRGNGPFTSASPLGQAYTADRWSTYFSTSSYSLSVTKETTIIDSTGTASMKVVSTLVSPDFAAMRQLVENFKDYAGKTVTISVRCNTNVAGMCYVSLASDSGTTNSVIHSGNGQWQTLTASLTLGANPTSLAIYLNVAQGSNVGTSYWDNAMLVVGPNPASFVPLHPQVDLARCQRYYIAMGNSGNPMEMWARGATDNVFMNLAQAIPLPVTMRITPTCTLATSFLREEGSAANISTAGYTMAIESGSTTFISCRIYKNVGGNPPNVWGFYITASADL